MSIKTYLQSFALTIKDIHTNIFEECLRVTQGVLPNYQPATGWLGFPHSYNPFKYFLLASETLLMSLWFVFYLLAKAHWLARIALFLLIGVLILTVPIIATVFSWVFVVFASALLLRTLLRMVASPEEYLIGAFARFASAHPLWTGILTLVTLGGMLVLTALLTGGAVVGAFAFLNPILGAVFSGVMVVYTGMQAYIGLVTVITLLVPLVMFMGISFWVGRLRPYLVPSFFRSSDLLSDILMPFTSHPIPFLLYLFTFSAAILCFVPNMLVASSVLSLLAWVSVSLVLTQFFLGDELRFFESHKVAAELEVSPGLSALQPENQNASQPAPGAASSPPGFQAFAGTGHRLGGASQGRQEKERQQQPSRVDAATLGCPPHCPPKPSA